MERMQIRGLDGKILIERDIMGKINWIHSICSMKEAQTCKATCPLFTVGFIKTFNEGTEPSSTIKTYEILCGCKPAIYAAYPGSKELAIEACEKLT